MLIARTPKNHQAAATLAACHCYPTHFKEGFGGEQKGEGGMDERGRGMGAGR